MYQEKLQQIQSSKGIKQTAVIIFGNYFSAFLSAIALILISRSFGPTIFGEFSAAFSLAMILAKLNDAGITIASQKFASKSTNKSETKSIISYGYKLKIILSISILIFFLPLSSYFTGLFKFSSPFIVPIGIILAVLITYYDQLVVSLLATHSFLKASLVNLTQATFKLVSSVLIVLIYPKALLATFTAFMIAPGIPVLIKNIFEPKWLSEIKTTKISSLNKTKFLNLAKHSALLVFVVGAMDSVGILFVKSFLNSYEAGLLGGISRIALLFILLGVSLSQVLNNRVSRYEKKQDLDIFIKKAFFLGLLSITAYLLTIPFLPFLIKISIGPDYLVATKPLIALLASVFIYIISTPFTALFYSFNKNIYFSISGVIQLVFLIAGNFILVPRYGIMGSALAQLLSRGILLLFTLLFGYKVYKEKFN